MQRRNLAVVAFGTLTLCSGCYKRTVVNDTLTVTSEWWVPTLLGLGGLAAIVLGIVMLLRKVDWYWPTISIVLGLMSLLYFCPDTAGTKVVIDNDSYYSKTGFWVFAKEQKVDFKDIETVTERVKESTGRKGRKEYTNYLVFIKKNNMGNQEIEFNGVMKDSLPELLEKLMDLGIEIRPLPER